MTFTIQLQATTIRNLQQQSGGINEQCDVDFGIDTHIGEKNQTKN